MFVYFSIHINDLKAIFVNVVVCKSNLKLMFKKQAIFYFDSEIFCKQLLHFATTVQIQNLGRYKIGVILWSWAKTRNATDH